MARRSILLLLVILASAAAITFRASAQSLPVLTRHVREVTLDGQAPLVGHLPEAQPLRLVLVLPLRNQPQLDQFLRDLYDPSNPNYRNFLTVEEFTSRFGPTQQDYNAVIRFAKANGLHVVGTSRNRLNIDVTGPVAAIEQAFHVTLGLYQHPFENRTFYAPDREPTPDLSVQLWHITGLDNYSIPRSVLAHRSDRDVNTKGNATTGSGPDASFLGSDMRAAYYGGTLTGSNQSLGLVEYAGTDLSDLNTYYANVHQTNNVPITLLSTDGTPTSCVYDAADDYCDDTEQTIDMTQALGMAPGMSSLVMYVGSSDSAIFNAMATADPLNAQLSCSWGWSPPDASTDNPYFEEFAAQGQNLFAAAGDDGEWCSNQNDDCFPYPADDVYITSVGGTDLETSSAGGPWTSESAWSDGGGGISPDDFTIPSWQTAAAAGCASCSQKYRNGPDVAANANFTFYVCADQSACTSNYWGGTSFATPMWAGYLALVNEQAISNGSKALGFINPSLYSIGTGSSYTTDFHDITSGCQSGGFCATTGYDLVTGWGTPNGSNLLNALAYVAPGFTLSSSSSSVTSARGYSSNVTLTSTVVGGFTSAIALSASGQPAGTTITFNPTSISGAGTSTMTIAVGSAAFGTYTITVKGTSGSISDTTTIALTIVKGPNIHVRSNE